ncbi:hypothetical protein [Pedobacter caeni]|uniref:Uncharacterized protein n=1 Tax=Pedobacter caeni TaxID=288992 RepID=A0A1M5DCF8_9SPHI|nr:hypothetical protein [Pedobacter caeni]SHF64733.1 hypothetical protein SAMN04488522_103176 [Pedobacter caeni]
MATIRAVSPTELTDPNYRSIAEDVSDKVILAAQRVLLSTSNRGIRMPAANNSIEHFFTGFYKGIPAEDIRLASQSLSETFKRTGTFTGISTKNATLFKKVDLVSASSVAAQLSGLSPNFKVFGQEGQAGQQPLNANWPGFGTSSLRWRVTRLDCLEETGLTAFGSDHVSMQGVMIDAYGNSTPTAISDLEGGWDTGNHKDWPDRTFSIANLDYGVGWPRPCTLVVAIAVSATSELIQLMDKIVIEVKEQVQKYAKETGLALGTKIGGPIGGLIGAGLGIIVGKIMAYVIDKLWGWLKSIFTKARLFPPFTMALDVPYQGGKFGSSLESGAYQITWTGHGGKYRATMDAVLNWGPASVLSALSMYKGGISLFKVNRENNIVGREWKVNTWTAWSGVAGGQASADSPVTAVKLFNSNKICLLVVGLDGKAWTYTTFVTIPGGPPPINIKRPWKSILNGIFTLGTVVAGISRNAGFVDVFATGQDGHIWSAGSGANGEWNGWWQLGQLKVPVGSPVGATSRSKDILDIFVTGNDGLVYTNSWGAHTGNVWTDWFYFNNHKFIPGIAITSISRKENQLDLFGVDTDGLPCVASWSPATGWQGWTVIPGATFTPGSTISVANHTPEHIDIFAVGKDGRIWTAACGPHTKGKWAGWWAIGDKTFAVGSSVAATSVQPGALNLFIDGADGNTWSAAHDGNVWTWYGNW